MGRLARLELLCIWRCKCYASSGSSWDWWCDKTVVSVQKQPPSGVALVKLINASQLGPQELSRHSINLESAIRDVTHWFHWRMSHRRQRVLVHSLINIHEQISLNHLQSSYKYYIWRGWGSVSKMLWSKFEGPSSDSKGSNSVKCRICNEKSNLELCINMNVYQRHSTSFRQMLTKRCRALSLAEQLMTAQPVSLAPSSSTWKARCEKIPRPPQLFKTSVHLGPYVNIYHILYTR